MENISIIEKPDWVTYDEIHNVLYAAHERNREQGIFMNTARLSGKQIKDRIGPEGKCFIALVNDRTIVGTVSASKTYRKCWYRTGMLVNLKMLGVIPEYQNQHISSLLYNKVEEYAVDNQIDLIELDTAENNTHSIEVYEKSGFRKVGYFASPNVKHYSVVMAKWLNNCPYSPCYANLRFLVKKGFIRFRYKKGGIKRLGI